MMRFVLTLLLSCCGVILANDTKASIASTEVYNVSLTEESMAALAELNITNFDTLQGGNTTAVLGEAPLADLPGHTVEIVSRSEADPVRWSTSVIVRSIGALRAFMLMDPATTLGSLPDVSWVDFGIIMAGLITDPIEYKTTLNKFAGHKLAGMLAIGAELRIILALWEMFVSWSATSVLKPEMAIFASIVAVAGMMDPIRNPTRSLIGGGRNIVGRLVQAFGYASVFWVVMGLHADTYEPNTPIPAPWQTIANAIGMVAGTAAVWHTRHLPALV